LIGSTKPLASMDAPAPARAEALMKRSAPLVLALPA